MPAISRFYGLVIKMFFIGSEHQPPHVHVVYGEYLGEIDIRTAELLVGDLPPRALALAKEWVKKYGGELLEIWNTQKFTQLPPLE